jgi:phenylalanyl-tRNA synthetase beta chain
MGGATTEMSETTTNVLVEVASWDPVSMFRTGRRHKLTSEAGKRNERGVDPTIPEAAADRVVELLVAHGGGTADPGVTKAGEAPVSPAIRISAGLPARVTGMEIDDTRVVECLEAVGCAVDGAEDLVVVPPPWRRDVTDPFDLVEEVARVVGYDQVPSVVPPAPSGRGLTREQRLRRRVGRFVAGAGLVEVLSFPFVGDAAFDALGLADDDVLRRTVRLANPLSAEEPAFTTTLLPGILRTAARNLGRGASGVALYETGTVAIPVDRGPAPIFGVRLRPSEAELAKLQDALPDQPLHLAAVFAGEWERSGWWGEGRTASWADAIGLVRELGTELGIDVEVRAAQRMPWHPGRCAQVLVGGAELGHAGELHPRVCAAHGLPRGSAALEVDLGQLIGHAVAVAGAPALSTFPVAKEDVALVVGDEVSADELARTLREGAGELCESVRLFDVYTGAQIGPGRKSLAFALRFRAPDRTLTETETAAARDAAVALAAERHGAEQRA